MAFDVLVPQMGESVLEGTVLEWKVKVGDKVKLNQPLVELMTDKVNVEIPAEIEGVLSHQFAKEGDVVPVGTRIAVIDDGKGEAETTTKPEAPAKPDKLKAVPTKEKAPLPPSAEVKGTAPKGKGKMSPKVRMLLRQYALEAEMLTPTGKDGLVTVDDVMRTVQGRSAQAGFQLGAIPPPPVPMPSASTAETAPTVPEVKEPKVKVEIPVFEPLPVSLRERRVPLAGVRKPRIIEGKKSTPGRCP